MYYSATTYRKHIGNKEMIMTGKELVINHIPCPTCKSTLLYRDGYRGIFVACDKTNRPMCPFTIGLDEKLIERSLRIKKKLDIKNKILQ